MHGGGAAHGWNRGPLNRFEQTEMMISYATT